MEYTKRTAKKQIKRDYTYAVGRRKESVARVRLYTTIKENHLWGEQKVSKDQILVNKMPVESYFSGQVAKIQYTRPFTLTDTLARFAVTVQVAGGGKNGQLEAMVHGISRALSKHDPKKFRAVLKKAELFTRDPRVRERRKVGTGGKARRAKQSPKR